MLDDDDLGAQTDEAVRSALQVLRGDGTEEDRARAAISLGPAMELHSFMEYYEDDGITEEVATEAEAALWEVYRNEAEPELLRRRCLESLARNPTDDLRAEITKTLTQSGPWKMTAVFAAGCTVGFEKEIREAASDDDLGVRIEAIRAAAGLGLKELGRHLVALARDDEANHDERCEAILALAQIDSDREEAFSLLEELEQHPRKEIRECAAAALEERLTMTSLAEELDDLL